MTPFLTFATLILGAVALAIWAQLRQARRAEFIRSYSLPPGLYARLQKRRPELSLKDCQLVGHALRQFFLACLKGGRRFVSMPSQVADDLWHEFILYTRNYQQFCRGAFGRFLHHTPAVVLGKDRQGNAGLRRCWWWVCREEHIDPRKPTRLPLLFALDAKLGIADGFHYTPDCSALRRAGDGSGSTPYCGGDFGDSSIDGGTDGFGDGGDGSGDGGCGGGCGGD
ncbi:MAG TPA: hypothetical protein VLM84_04220 [Chromatiaceae bacterium]|jgi:hypothetical protein|nr:hypothetical protein [Chromatiaceae bacterium]